MPELEALVLQIIGQYAAKLVSAATVAEAEKFAAAILKVALAQAQFLKDISPADEVGQDLQDGELEPKPGEKA